MLDSLYASFVDAIADGRGFSTQQAKSLIDDPPMTPEQALERGLVDDLLFYDEAIEAKQGKKRLTFKRYLKKVREQQGHSESKVAVIHLQGTIVSGDGGTDVFGGRFIGDQSTAEWLDDVREDDAIRAVVLRINSPGGSGLASDNIWRAVERLRSEKPVVVSMGDYAASGGYYIAMGADLIYAEPTTLTGSIGVFGGKLNFGDAFDKVGIRTHHYKRGELADLFSTTQDFSPTGRARFQEFLDSFYDLFLQRVAIARGLDREAVHDIAQGRVWTGTQAVERGLVDDLGGLNDAVASAAILAEIDDDYSVVRMPSTQTFWDTLMDDLASSKAKVKPNVAAWAELVPGGLPTLRRARAIARALEPTGVAAMLDFRIDVR